MLLLCFYERIVSYENYNKRTEGSPSDQYRLPKQLFCYTRRMQCCPLIVKFMKCQLKHHFSHSWISIIKLNTKKYKCFNGLMHWTVIGVDKGPPMPDWTRELIALELPVNITRFHILLAGPTLTYDPPCKTALHSGLNMDSFFATEI